MTVVGDEKQQGPATPGGAGSSGSRAPSGDDLRAAAAEVRRHHRCRLSDASDFKSDLHVHGIERDGFEVLLMTSPVVPNSIAALLLHIRDVTGVLPGVYFEWTEGNPVANLFRFLFTGEGEVAPTTREVLRRAEPDRDLRPTVHVA